MFGMSNNQTKAFCYGAMLILVAIDWTAIGAGLLLAVLDFADEDTP